MQKCFYRVAKFILNLIIIVLSFTAAHAAQPVVHLSPKPSWLSICKPYDKKPALRTVEDGYFFALIEHQVEVEKQADYHHIIREIVSETGIQNGSEISVSFDPAFEKLDFHSVTVWRDGKSQNRLKVSAFKVLADEKDLSNFIYQGTYSALCILDDIRKGDRIEYSYTITGRNPIFNNKFCGFLYLQSYQTVAHQYAALIVSAQHKLNMKAFNELSKPSITDVGGSKKYEWEDFQIKPALYDENEPGWYDARAYVQVSDYNSWAEVNDWAQSINPAKTDIKGELAERIAKLKLDAGNDKEKYFRNAVKTVQDEVRYMGIEIGQYSHRANNPEKVFTQRYGDCKDKSLLLVSMLRANGIDANMVLVNSNGGDIGTFIPANNVFDHAVVVAQVNGKPVWVDATISYQRGAGTAIYFPNYGKGLVLKPGNNALAVIPDSKTGKIVCEDKFTIKDEKSPVKFEVKTTYTLNQADKIRYRLASAGMAETEKNYLKYYSGIYNKIESKDSVVVIDNEDKNELTTIEKYEITDYFKKDSVSGKYEAGFYANGIKEQLPDITNQTKTPISVNYPFNEDYTVKVILKSGWDIPDAHNSISRDAYRFSSAYSASGNTLTLNYQFAYLKGVIPVNKLAEFKKDIKELSDNALSYSISYSPGGSSSNNTDVNQWMLNMVLLIVLLLGFVGYRIYHQQTPPLVFTYGNSFISVGGWLILVAIGLFVTPVTVIMAFVNTRYLQVSVWDNLGAYRYGNSLKAQVIFEVAGETVLMCYAVFCLILLLNRRDILPKYIIGYFIFATSFFVADYAFVASVSHLKVPDSYITTITRSFIIGVVWISYFKKSTRVKQTFLVPYPAYNYTYQQPDTIISDEQQQLKD
ncbi:DUF3857 domain-containing protein [Mucilaginibacter sp.]|uniref:DUF3857 domain-containing protein n=1 Tax=Mucilaginibacter sp. TaxID=1882438 RepID=UPI003D112320